MRMQLPLLSKSEWLYGEREDIASTSMSLDHALPAGVDL
jgi:hypothetical protein